MNQPNPLLYFFAGERSGDLHGSRLISALRSPAKKYRSGLG